MRVGLVGCVKSKLMTRAPARDLYTSPLFLRRRAWVERTCDRWFVLSALHGLVDPDQELEPYDLALSDLGRADRRRWSSTVLDALEAAVGPPAGHVFEVHAGDAYVQWGLAEGLDHMGAKVERPMSGLTLGEQLAAYARRDAPAPGDSPTRQHQQPSASRPRPFVGGSSGKYAPLLHALERSSAASLTLSFRQVEDILGFPLPMSARRYAAWWQNDASGSHSHARAWLAAGHMVRANLAKEVVTFSRYGESS